jgi:DNA-binding response OmpR family regulator
VLVVDDEAPLRELIAVALGDEFACDEAEDGAEALTKLRAAPPDLVFLDVMLPGVSGLDVLEEMRTDRRLQRVPVVVVSAWQASDDVSAAIERGADRFLAKPFDVEELASMARELVKQGR